MKVVWQLKNHWINILCVVFSKPTFFMIPWAAVMLRLNMWFIFHREHNSPLTAKQNNSWGQQSTAVLCTCCLKMLLLVAWHWCCSFVFPEGFLLVLCVYVCQGRAGRTIKVPFLSSRRLFCCFVGLLKASSFFWNSDSAGEEGRQPWWVDLPTAGSCQHAGGWWRLSIARRSDVGISVQLHQATHILFHISNRL